MFGAHVPGPAIFREPSHDHDPIGRLVGAEWLQQSMKGLRPMMDGWYHDGVGWGGWVMMTLAMVAFWGLVVFVVVALFRSASGSADRYGPRDPMEILNERFARGEIDADEYHARQEVLRNSAKDIRR